MYGFYAGSGLPITGYTSNAASPSVITVTCSANHGLIAGSPIVNVVTSTGTFHNLMGGNFFVETVPTANTFTFTARVWFQLR